MFSYKRLQNAFASDNVRMSSYRLDSVKVNRPSNYRVRAYVAFGQKWLETSPLKDIYSFKHW